VLTADTATLRGFADALRGLARDSAGDHCEGLGPADLYTRTFVRFDDELPFALYSMAESKTHENSEAIQNFFRRQRTVLEACAQEVDETSAAYAATDRTAGGLFGALGAPAHAGELVPWSRAVYTLPPPPLSALIAPRAASGHDYVAEILTTDWFSPTSTLRTVMNWVLDYDPLAEVSKIFSGDWDLALVCAEALPSLGEFEKELAASVSTAMSQLLDGWTGDAAHEAASYFAELVNRMEANGERIVGLASGYEMLAMAIQSNAKLVGAAFEALIDQLIAAALFYALGLLTSETIVGGIVGGLGGSVTLLYAVELAETAWSALQTAWVAVDAAVAAIGVIESFMNSVGELPLPAAYDSGQP